jgi:hypothetical protein
MHSGYRAYSREVLLTVPFLRNSLGFVFDTEMIMQAVHFGFRVGEVPVPTKYFDEASSVGLRPATVYGLRTLGVGVRLVLHRADLIPCRRFRP